MTDRFNVLQQTRQGDQVQLTESGKPRALRGSASLVALLLIGIGVSGCGVISDRSQNYVDAPEGKPLQGPDGEPLARQRDAYPVRQVSATGATGHRGGVPRPPDMTADILDENYVIENLDEQSWLLVNDVPGRIWPAINAWMTERGLGIASSSTQLGMLQSEVVNYSRRARTLLELDDAADGEELMQVQARLVAGVRRRTTEIQIRPMIVGEGARELIQWQDEPLDQGLEESLLSDLSEFLQAREDSRSYSRAALGMVGERRVTLEAGDEDNPRRIAIELPYDRAWNEIRRILSDENVPVLDLDQTAGYFLVDGRSAEDRQRGWPARWFAGRERSPQINTRIQLERDGERVVVTADKAEGFRGQDYSGEVLSRLFDYLY